MQLYFKALLFWLQLTVVLNDEINWKDNVARNTAIAHEIDDRLLLFTTLDGTLLGVEQDTGNIKWRVKDKAIVEVPVNADQVTVPIFLPDPRDGSLYVIGNSREPLKKLPFTIPQLVSTSPCKSSDGILYTGKKKDAWFKLDPKTGMKQQILGWDSISPTCPLETSSFVYIGRTKYSIMMVDSFHPQRKWNITFYDYAAVPMDKEKLNSFNVVLFTSSSTGKIVALDRRSGQYIWELDLASPVVGSYLLDTDGLLAAPYTTLANHTLTHLTTELLNSDGLFSQSNYMKLYPTLYVGEHVYGLYAIPSLVDQNVVKIITSDSGRLLLSGPHAEEAYKTYREYPIPGYNYQIPPDMYDGDPLTFQSIPGFGNHIVIFTGHYDVPKFTNTRFMLPGQAEGFKLLTDTSATDIVLNKHEDISRNTIGIQTTEDDINESYKDKSQNYFDVVEIGYKNFKHWLKHQENKGLQLTVIILVGCLIAMFFYLQMQVREIQNLSQNGSKTSQNGSTGKNSGVTAYSEELPDGTVKVGKIIFYPDQLLGKGCEGTFVYKGEFDKRQVAVKRLLPDCFTFADREVALLRESDAHPYVVRYFCMEQDRMFRYIALELCQATLSEYIQKKCPSLPIKPLEILKQATQGLAHLHSLDIVHRDIKPHNVLISMPNSNGDVKAMISDFGLCKKLQVGRISFSRRSGVTGTDGWIAPEMLHGNRRMTCAVDLFSLGCLYYYVLSEGSHPFGDSLRRQANILNGEWNISDLRGKPWEVNLQIPLITSLISDKPEYRPSCKTVLTHPIFWDASKILAFLQDVSDRVEKAEIGDSVLQSLEFGGENIVRLDWRAHIDEEVVKDLRKYRTYHGDSVRDLLRALRNKKHHFRELTIEAQESLGEIPNDFTSYWMLRFPLLIVHAWISMQCVSHENIFTQYYSSDHTYSLSQFRKQVRDYILENPLTLPEDHVEGKYDFCSTSNVKYKVYNKKNSFANDLNRNLVREKNAGLYRNLGSPNPDLRLGIVDVGEINLSLPKVAKKPSLHRRFPRKKHKNDEPLVWATNDK